MKWYQTIQNQWLHRIRYLGLWIIGKAFMVVLHEDNNLTYIGNQKLFWNYSLEKDGLKWNFKWKEKTEIIMLQIIALRQGHQHAIEKIYV